MRHPLQARAKSGSWVLHMLRTALCLCGLTGAVLAAEPVPASGQKILDVSQIQKGSVVLTDYFAILEDKSLTLTLSDVQGQDFSDKFTTGQPATRSLNFGVTASAYWLRLKLNNSTGKPLSRMLEISYPRLAASVQMHQPGGEGVGADGYRTIDTGYSKPFANRGYKHHFYVFPITVSPNTEQVIYLRFQGPTNMEIPAVLWTREAFHDYERWDYMSQAVYFGIVLAMVSFNLLLFIALRDYNYLLYITFISVAALTFAANNGLAIEFLWGDSPYWITFAHTVGYCLSVSLMILFMRKMVDIKTLFPRVDLALKGIIAYQMAMVVGLAISFPTFVRPTLMGFALSSFFVLFSGIICAIKRDRGAYFFVAAFSVLCLAAVMSALRGLNILPTNVITTEGIQFGSAVEMLLLAFALADRYNVLRREKARAQMEALDAQTHALEAEQRVVETLKESERVLEGRVKERTAELSETIEKLKQTQADLVQAEKLASLGSLVAGVAHELNTPIGNALVTASTLEEAAQESNAALARGDIRKSALTFFIENTVSMAALITRSCNRAANLISSFKQIAVDQTTEQRRVFDLRSLVDDNIAALRPSFKGQPWVIEVDVPTDISCDSYPGPLGQVIANLVNNAMIHAFDERESGTVVISSRLTEGVIEMSVKDDGKGMDEATLSRIFDPFFTTQLGQGGSGLGLSISLNIVTGMLGGHLTAISEPGRGSCFVIRFPQNAA